MNHAQPSGTPSSRVCSLWAAESVYYPCMTRSRNLLPLQDLNYNSQPGHCCQGFCNATDTAFVPHGTAKLLQPLHLGFMDNITGAMDQWRSLHCLNGTSRWPGAQRRTLSSTSRWKQTGTPTLPASLQPLTATGAHSTWLVKAIHHGSTDKRTDQLDYLVRLFFTTKKKRTYAGNLSPAFLQNTQGISNAGKSIPLNHVWDLIQRKARGPRGSPACQEHTAVHWTREEGWPQLERSCCPRKRHRLHCSVLCLRVTSRPACRSGDKRRVQYCGQHDHSTHEQKGGNLNIEHTLPVSVENTYWHHCKQKQMALSWQNLFRWR